MLKTCFSKGVAKMSANYATLQANDATFQLKPFDFTNKTTIQRLFHHVRAHRIINHPVISVSFGLRLRAQVAMCPAPAKLGSLERVESSGWSSLPGDLVTIYVDWGQKAV